MTLRRTVLLLSVISFTTLYGVTVSDLAAQDTVAGTWALSIQTAQGVVAAEMTFASGVEGLTGVIRTAEGELAVSGISDAQTIRFYAVSGEITFVFSGQRVGDSMSGTLEIGDSGSGSWTATRK